MTNLHEVNFGLNQYCGPSVLSALTGESTDRCAAVISAVSGKREIKAVQMEHLIEAFKRLGFDSKKFEVSGRTLYVVLLQLSTKEGFYIVLVPKHVVAIEVLNKEIYIVDNHSKQPLPAGASARLMQKVEGVYRVEKKAEPELVSSEITIDGHKNRLTIYRVMTYKDPADNSRVNLGSISFIDYNELREIVSELKSFTRFNI